MVNEKTDYKFFKFIKVHFYVLEENKTKATVVRRWLPNYHFLTLCGYQMMKLEGQVEVGGTVGMELYLCVTLEQVYSVFCSSSWTWALF
jgi:hypothetical protein